MARAKRVVEATEPKTLEEIRREYRECLDREMSLVDRSKSVGRELHTIDRSLAVADDKQRATLMGERIQLEGEAEAIPGMCGEAVRQRVLAHLAFLKASADALRAERDAWQAEIDQVDEVRRPLGKEFTKTENLHRYQQLPTEEYQVRRKELFGKIKEAEAPLKSLRIKHNQANLQLKAQYSRARNYGANLDSSIEACYAAVAGTPTPLNTTVNASIEAWRKAAHKIGEAAAKKAAGALFGSYEVRGLKVF